MAIYRDDDLPPVQFTIDPKPTWGHPGYAILEGITDIGKAYIGGHSSTPDFDGDGINEYPTWVEFDGGGGVWTTPEIAHEALRNARLMAIGPEAIALLKRLVDQWEMGALEYVVRDAKALIKKANGIEEEPVAQEFPEFEGARYCPQARTCSHPYRTDKAPSDDYCESDGCTVPNQGGVE